MNNDLHLRNLAVPFLSQRKNEYTWEERYIKNKTDENGKLVEKAGEIKPDGDKISMACRSCNITCVTMVLRYFGITQESPDDLMRRYFETDKAAISAQRTLIGMDAIVPGFTSPALQWWKNLELLVNTFYADTTVSCQHLTTMNIDTIRSEIGAGYPVIVSVGMEKGKESGHIVVVRGFSKVGTEECIIVNDPWGSPGTVVNNIGSEGRSYWGGYYNGASGNDESDGDNIVIKVNEFKKMLNQKNSVLNALTIHAPQWCFPDGSTDFSTTEEEAAIYAKENYVGGGFPIKTNSLWHNGIHLKIDRNIKSIGSGRLIAVRNCKNNPANGDASFVLIEHSFKKDNKLKRFYALYMHVHYVDLASYATEYFSKGTMSDTIEWPKQLFRRMLPIQYIVANLNSEAENSASKEGLINESYQAITLYNAHIADDFFHKDGASSLKLERRVLVQPLPIQNTKLYKQLKNPQTYGDADFIKGMLNPCNYKKVIDNIAYIFFFYKETLVCIEYEKTILQKGARINAKLFKYTAGKIADITKDTTTSFIENIKPDSDMDVTQMSEIIYKTYGTHPTMKKYVESKKPLWNAAYNRIKTNAHSEQPYRNSYDEHGASYEEILQHIYELNEGNGRESIQNNIGAQLTQLGAYYATQRKHTLKEFLEKTLEVKNKNDTASFGSHAQKDSGAQSALSWIQSHASEMLHYAQTTYGISVKTDTIQNASSGKALIRELCRQLKPVQTEYPLAMKYIIENLCINLMKIPVSHIHRSASGDENYFTTNDGSISELLTAYHAVFEYIASVYTHALSLHYVDSYIEIAKNTVIAHAGYYNGNSIQNTRIPQIHFELFAEEELWDTDPDVTFKDSDGAAFFNPRTCVEQLKKLIPDEHTHLFKALDSTILLKDEIKILYDTVPMLRNVACCHVSEWATRIEWKQLILKSSFLFRTCYVVSPSDGSRNNSGSATQTNTHIKAVPLAEYIDDYYLPYMWMNPSVFDTQKRYFKKNTAWYYHPLLFIERIATLW